jgi:DNA sulfur modification protein DndD
VVASRKNKLLKVDNAAAAAIEEVQDELSALISRKDELVQNLASLQSQLEQATYLHQKVVGRLQSEGGELFSQKSLLELTKVRLETELQGLDSSLREDSARAAPLLLVAGLLDTIHAQARRENTAVSAQILGAVLQERDTLVIDGLREAGARAALVKTISGLLDRDRKARMEAGRSPRYLSLSENAQVLLQELRTSRLASVRGMGSKHLARREQLVEELAVRLAPVLRVYEGCARVLTGEIAGATHPKTPSRRAEDFLPGLSGVRHTSASGALEFSVRVDLRSFNIKNRQFKDSNNPPVLHRKELFVPDD